MDPRPPHPAAPGTAPDAGLRSQREATPMDRDAERLLAEILKLPEPARGELLRKVQESLAAARMRAPIEWPELIKSSMTVEESARAIEDGRL